jgi:hypothetical protein
MHGSVQMRYENLLQWGFHETLSKDSINGLNQTVAVKSEINWKLKHSHF